MKKRNVNLEQVGTKPKHEKLPWPGLKAKDHLTRVVTRAVKQARETRENEEWAENQIARVLDYVPPETAIRLVLRETRRQRKPIRRLAKFLLRLLETVERAGGIIKSEGEAYAPQKEPDWFHLGEVILETRGGLKDLGGRSVKLTIKGSQQE